MTNKRECWEYESDDGSDVEQLVGYSVEARDGEIGNVDDATAEATANRIAVDTGFWIFGKKRLIPAGVIERVDHDTDTVYVSMTKEEIKDAPDWHEAMDFNFGYYDAADDYYSGYVI